MSSRFVKPVERNSKQINEIITDVKLTQTNVRYSRFLQRIYIFLVMIIFPIVNQFHLHWINTELIIMYYLVAWFLFFGMSIHQQPTAGIAPNVFDSIVGIFRKGKTFTDTKNNYIEAIKNKGYEPLLDSLISENQEILSRKLQQDSDRFNLLFNSFLFFLLGYCVADWTSISTFISHVNIPYVSLYELVPFVMSIGMIGLLEYFRHGELLHELGDGYTTHLMLQDALFEMKNDEILKVFKRAKYHN